MNTTLIQQLTVTEKLASTGRWKRMMNDPYKYLTAILHRRMVYPITKQHIQRKAKLFFEKDMTVALPSSSDIYLTGGKSDDSEIRLARYMILNLQAGDHFLDVGAHFGYYTLLGLELVGREGSVFAYEPSESFDLLKKNTQGLGNVVARKQAISENPGVVTIYEFSNLYSEFNTIDISQFANEPWLQGAAPRAVQVASDTIDAVVGERNFMPTFIKIDVEGAEDKVIAGGMNFFEKHSPVIAMEFLADQKINFAHRKADSLLRQCNYKPYSIEGSGKLTAIIDVGEYLRNSGLRSDNIIYQKQPAAL